MKVTRGGSTEYGKRRVDYELEEVDLLCMLAEHGVEDPEALRKSMPSQVVMQIMDAEAQAFLHFALSKMEPAEKDKHLLMVKAYHAERDRLLDVCAPKAPAE